VAEVSAANAGFVAPVTALVDGGQALVIDPGPSLAHGRRVRQAVACQLRARVVAVVNTHAHAENVLGNAAFADVARVYASAPTAQAMADRCPQCLQSLSDRVGADAMAGTHIVLPTRVLKAGDTLRVGAHRVRVWAVEAGHTEGDLVLWMPRTRTLWVGGLAYQGRVPELAQGRLDSWVLALERLMALPARVVVSTVVSSGATPGGAHRALADTHAYLLALRERVWAAMDAGGSPHDVQALAVPWAGAWVGYEARHGFNAQRAWRELEPGWMAR
jgi:glyoxylase-like metal-dependent hydrolase (beta-lactamase superfamily II)